MYTANFITILTSLTYLTITQTKENNDLENHVFNKNGSGKVNYSQVEENGTAHLPALYVTSTEIPRPIDLKNFDYDYSVSDKDTKQDNDLSRKLKAKGDKQGSNRQPFLNSALQNAAQQGLDALSKLLGQIEPEIVRKRHLLEPDHPAFLFSQFSAPAEGFDNTTEAAYALLVATKSFRKSYKQQIPDFGRQATTEKITFRRTALEALCPPRTPPICLPAAQRYRTHDGTCNNMRRPRWGSAQMPFNRFLPPDYSDGIDSVRASVQGGPLSSARFVSLVVHGAADGDGPVTLMLAQWGQLIDHDLTSTAQPRSINGSIPRCCGTDDSHPSCFPIKVPKDDPWLAPLKVRCLEFLRSAPAQRRDCDLSWREQTNQATSFLDASPVYSSNARTSDSARVFRNGLLVFGRGNPQTDICLRGGMSRQCVRAGDSRSNEQPGLLALHHVFVAEHNRIALELSDLNPHWSDEKVYQETRRIIGAIFQHITFREFLPLVLGREVCRIFDLELLSSGYYTGYDWRVNPSIGNSFAAAAFRFGHSLIQGSYLRCDQDHNFLNNNVTLHEEFSSGDLGSMGSLHRLIRGLAVQRAQTRDEFITPELTNHLFQSGNFPFGLDLAAINIHRGRDHGIPPYTAWREPCGLTPINNWADFESVVGPGSSKRISNAYRSVHDIDLFVGGIAERPVVGGLVGPTFACIIAQQFSNLRKGDRFWYENSGFESSFTPAQLHSIRRVSLAQILCRAVGSGTFQPHIFIPHDFEDNARISCGFGPLAPIDLSPWFEFDPFLEKQTLPQNNNVNIKRNLTILNKIRPTNNFTGQNRPTHSDLIKIHDKLDFKQKVQPDKVNNKLDADKRKLLVTKTENGNHTKKTGTNKRTVFVNNIPVLLRNNIHNRKRNGTLTTTQMTPTSNSKTIENVRSNTENTQNLKVTTDSTNRTETTTFKDSNTVQKLPRNIEESYEDLPYEIEINIKHPSRKKTKPIDDTKIPYSDNYYSVSTPYSYFMTTPTRQTKTTKYTKPPTIIFLDQRDSLPSQTASPSNYFLPISNYGDKNRPFGASNTPSSFLGDKPISAFSSAVSLGNFGSISGVINSEGSGNFASFNVNVKPSSQVDVKFSKKDGTTIKPYYPVAANDFGLPISSYPPANMHDYGYSSTHSPFSSRPTYPLSSIANFNFYDLPSTTKRPFSQTTLSYYPQFKDLASNRNTLPDDMTKHKTNVSDTSSDTDDDYYVDDDDSFGFTFDKDGYLRPEHMKIETLVQDFNEQFLDPNISQPLDDFVLPVLNKTNINLHPPTVKPAKTYVISPRRSNSDISAESPKPADNAVSQIAQKPAVAFAPLNVLTKPERPDKWVMINPEKEQSPLPDQPDLKVDTISSKEFPHPIKTLFVGIRKRFKLPSFTKSP